MSTVMASQPWSVHDHEQVAKDIARMEAGFSYYIDEVHAKKATNFRGKFKLNSKADDVFYSKCLFHGLNWRQGFNDFPCEFQGEMESVLYCEHPDAETCDGPGATYYRKCHTGWTLNLEPLSTHPCLTDGDRALITEHNNDAVSLMEKCIDKAKPYREDSGGFKRMVKHIARVKKVLVPLEAAIGRPTRSLSGQSSPQVHTHTHRVGSLPIEQTLAEAEEWEAARHGRSRM